MAKITPRKEKETIIVKTKKDSGPARGPSAWWKARSKRELANQVLETAGFLKEQQQYRYRRASIFARLYSNQPLMNVAGSTLGKGMNTSSLPIDRPTMNIVQSIIDTKVARITQSRPKPTFLTDNGDYKQRKLAKQMNAFISGELYQIKAHAMGESLLRDAEILGTGAWKVLKTSDRKVGLERRLIVELLVDPNDALYGKPMQMFEFKLIDRAVIAADIPEYQSSIAQAEQAFPEGGADASKTISDQIIVVEAWRLPSSKDADDGRHCIVCTAGVILDEPWKKQKFPFVFLHSSEGLTGMWGQGAAERLMGTQVDINKMLITSSKATDLMGVPRVWLEDGSKVVKANFNNNIGMIGTYRGTLPVEVPGTTGLGPDFYQRLQSLIEYGYQQEGVSELAASSEKPAGLDSGEAIRSFDNIQSDRLSSLNRRYNEAFVELSYHIIENAIEIAEEDGSYETVYPDKDGTKEINLPDIGKLKDDPFVVQCFDASSLPHDPSGRLAKVTEMMQSGLITPQEGRRLLDFPDIEQVDKLENACEERILQSLDAIVENGKYTPPDPFMMAVPGLALKLVTQYYNLYAAAKLEESRCQMLRDFFIQVQTINAAAQPPPMPGAPGQPGPQAVPQSPPVSDTLPNAPSA